MTPAHWILLAASMVLAICACIFLWRENDRAEWRKSSLRQSVPESNSQETVAQPTVHAEKELKGRFQEFVEYPILQPYVGFTLGFWIPAMLIVLAIGDAIEDTRFELVSFYSLILIWNLCFVRIFRFHLRLPIIPIPILWVSVALILIGFWDLCFGKY